MNRNQLFLIMLAAVFLSGCGGGSSSPPPPPTLSVAFSTMPPSSMMPSGTASVAATVTNDSAAAGVTWSCTPTGACGTFSPTATKSGIATNYTAPAAIPAGGKVTIIATSVTDSTKSVNVQVTISGASNATLKGQYAFLITAPTGNSATRGTTTFAGSVNLDGNGHLVQSGTCPWTTGPVSCAGMEDIVSTYYYDQADPILPTTTNPLSTYTVDASGHGTMTIQTQNGETLHFSFVLTSASHALISETNGEPGSGTLDMQSAPFAASQVSGSYAFTMEGVNPTQPPTAKLAFGGVFAANTNGTISSGTLDVNSNGTITSGQAFSGTIDQTPDFNGRGRFHITLGRSFTFYVVSAKVLRLFEDDSVDLMGGSAYAQGTATAALSGKFVYQHGGWSSTGRTVAAGQFTANGTSSITAGISDANVGGAPPTVPSTAKAVSGTFAGGASSTGTLNLTDAAATTMSTFNMYMVDATLNILDPNNSSGGGGALLLHTDSNIIGTGIVIPQVISGSPAITSTHALNLINSIATATTPSELDFVGVVASDGSSNFTNGMADYDRCDSASPTTVTGASFTGTFTADSANAGRFTGSFSIPMPTGGYVFIPPSATTLSVSIYQASSSQAFVIQTDNTANVRGYLLQQNLP